MEPPLDRPFFQPSGQGWDDASAPWLAYGPRAQSPQYCADLLQSALPPLAVGAANPNAELSCHWLYAVSFRQGRQLHAQERDKIAQLLHIQQPPADDTAGSELWVAPRLGVTTPWSSKATEILRSCRLPVDKVEALYAWRLRTSDDDRLWHAALLPRLHDPMRQTIGAPSTLHPRHWGNNTPPGRAPKLHRIDLQTLLQPQGASDADRSLLLALNEDERDWLTAQLRQMGRENITAAELMMFAQVNSEHCRHWIFKSLWESHTGDLLDSLFDLIRSTSRADSGSGFKPGLISCYSDNAAVFAGAGEHLLAPDGEGRWQQLATQLHLVAKAETHNHPTGISPWPGAATGVGGEIRDEAAAGRGARSKLGVAGYMVSYPGWDPTQSRPPLSPAGAPFAGPRQILAEAPLGAAAFGNEFGRPNLAGFLRTLEVPAAAVSTPAMPDIELWGYDKPLMLAGGLGQMLAGQEYKAPVPAGAHLVVLGGPAMRIGIGGGAASSVQAGEREAQIDFASVQRENPEMQRRCQEVLDACWRQGDDNPILFIHDLGAGGLSNAVPELLHDCGRSGELLLKPEGLLDELGMRAEEIWCNESQERFLLALHPDRLRAFTALCRREACPHAVIGTTTDGAKGQMRVRLDADLVADAADSLAVDLPLATLFDYNPPTLRTLPPPEAARQRGGAAEHREPQLTQERFARTLGRLLAQPAVGSKAFLIQIGDRSVGGMTARDQMVGANQIPVADCAMTLSGHVAEDHSGEAVALGERAPLAILDPAASVRMAAAEALTNLAAAGVANPAEAVFSANWMAATGQEQADACLQQAVSAFAAFCRALGTPVPVGKDSLFMRSSAWRNFSENSANDKNSGDQAAAHWLPERPGQPCEVVSPLTLAVTAFAPVADVRRQLSAALAPEGDSLLLHLDLGGGQQRMGGSTWQQLQMRLHGPTPDVVPRQLCAFMRALADLNRSGEVLAYHDLSDGGVFAGGFEMALAGGCGLRLFGDTGDLDRLASLLCHEEAGALLQVRADRAEAIVTELADAGLHARCAGRVLTDSRLEIGDDESSSGLVLSLPMTSAETTPPAGAVDLTEALGFANLAEAWSWHSNRVRLARGDRQQQVEQEAKHYATAAQRLAPSTEPSLWHGSGAAALADDTGRQPRVAIVREQGVNGQLEMAAAFMRAGFQAQDLHINDLLHGAQPPDLSAFDGLAFCGGFSYGDTLGAGRGWGRKIIDNDELREEFARFIGDDSKFVLGICNGCQALAAMREIIPGAEHWPEFVGNQSERYEARLVQVAIDEAAAARSPLLAGMGGQSLLVPVSHGEGRVRFAGPEEQDAFLAQGGAGAACRYSCGAQDGRTGESDGAVPYPLNPNGSAQNLAGVYAAQGRVLAMMPHPERVFRTAQLSWAPAAWRRDDRGHWRDDSPWMQLFRNAAKMAMRRD